MSEPVELEVFSDVACPWCFVGRRRLQGALAAELPGAVRVQWRAFVLQPDIPEEGLEGDAFNARRFGSRETALRALAGVRAEAAKEGLEYDFAAQRRVVNTMLAHRASVLAGPARPEVLEALFSGFFEHGVDVGDVGELLAWLREREVPVDVEAMGIALRAGRGREEVQSELALAPRMGVTAVPYFVADRRVGLPGAQQPAVLAKLFAAARRRREQDAA